MLPSMSDSSSSPTQVVVRPSRSKFFSSFTAGGKRAKMLLPAILPLMAGSAGMAYAFSHGNVTVVVVGAVAGLAPVAPLFMRQLPYLPCVTLVVEPCRVQLLGVPFPMRPA